jgi:hypothetical protein
MNERTIGEQRFEQYLRAVDYPFEFEREYPGRRKRPDYTVTKFGTSLYDVKDFDPDMPPGFTQFDPHVRIRRRIDYGRKKFKEFKDFPCSVVLQNNINVFVHTETPAIVLGSMYGDLGYLIPVNVGPKGASGPPPSVQQAFLGGACMLPNKNTTVSALVTLRYIAIGRLRLRQIWAEQPALSVNDAIEAAKARFGKDFDPDEMQQGVIVWENIYARIPLPRDLFTGPFDQRWGREGDDLAILFCGPLLATVSPLKTD